MEQTQLLIELGKLHEQSNLATSSDYITTFTRVNEKFFGLKPDTSTTKIDGKHKLEIDFDTFYKDKIKTSSWYIDKCLDNIPKAGQRPNFATQESVWKEIKFQLSKRLSKRFKNINLLIIGAQGSGKTYTLFGGNTFPERGILPRFFEFAFDQSNDSPTCASYLQDESIIDVFDSGMVHSFQGNLSTVPTTGPHPLPVLSLLISSPQRALELLSLSMKAVSLLLFNSLNFSASRSFSLFFQCTLFSKRLDKVTSFQFVELSSLRVPEVLFQTVDRLSGLSLNLRATRLIREMTHRPGRKRDKKTHTHSSEMARKEKDKENEKEAGTGGGGGGVSKVPLDSSSEANYSTLTFLLQTSLLVFPNAILIACVRPGGCFFEENRTTMDLVSLDALRERAVNSRRKGVDLSPSLAQTFDEASFCLSKEFHSCLERSSREFSRERERNALEYMRLANEAREQGREMQQAQEESAAIAVEEGARAAAKVDPPLQTNEPKGKTDKGSNDLKSWFKERREKNKFKARVEKDWSLIRDSSILRLLSLPREGLWEEEDGLVAAAQKSELGNGNEVDANTQLIQSLINTSKKAVIHGNQSSEDNDLRGDREIRTQGEWGPEQSFLHSPVPLSEYYARKAVWAWKQMKCLEWIQSDSSLLSRLSLERLFNSRRVLLPHEGGRLMNSLDNTPGSYHGDLRRSFGLAPLTLPPLFPEEDKLKDKDKQSRSESLPSSIASKPQSQGRSLFPQNKFGKKKESEKSVAQSREGAIALEDTFQNRWNLETGEVETGLSSQLYPEKQLKPPDFLFDSDENEDSESDSSSSSSSTFSSNRPRTRGQAVSGPPAYKKSPLVSLKHYPLRYVSHYNRLLAFVTKFSTPHSISSSYSLVDTKRIESISLPPELPRSRSSPPSRAHSPVLFSVSSQTSAFSPLTSTNNSLGASNLERGEKAMKEKEKGKWVQAKPVFTQPVLQTPPSPSFLPVPSPLFLEDARFFGSHDPSLSSLPASKPSSPLTLSSRRPPSLPTTLNRNPPSSSSSSSSSPAPPLLIEVDNESIASLEAPIPDTLHTAPEVEEPEEFGEEDLKGLIPPSPWGHPRPPLSSTSAASSDTFSPEALSSLLEPYLIPLCPSTISEEFARIPLKRGFTLVRGKEGGGGGVTSGGNENNLPSLFPRDALQSLSGVDQLHLIRAFLDPLPPVHPGNPNNQHTHPLHPPPSHHTSKLQSHQKKKMNLSSSTHPTSSFQPLSQSSLSPLSTPNEPLTPAANSEEDERKRWRRLRREKKFLSFLSSEINWTYDLYTPPPSTLPSDLSSSSPVSRLGTSSTRGGGFSPIKSSSTLPPSSLLDQSNQINNIRNNLVFNPLYLPQHDSFGLLTERERRKEEESFFQSLQYFEKNSFLPPNTTSLFSSSHSTTSSQNQPQLLHLDSKTTDGLTAFYLLGPGLNPSSSQASSFPIHCLFHQKFDEVKIIPYWGATSGEGGKPGHTGTTEIHLNGELVIDPTRSYTLKDRDVICIGKARFFMVRIPNSPSEAFQRALGVQTNNLDPLNPAPSNLLLSPSRSPLATFRSSRNGIDSDSDIDDGEGEEADDRIDRELGQKINESASYPQNTRQALPHSLQNLYMSTQSFLTSLRSGQIRCLTLYEYSLLRTLQSKHLLPVLSVSEKERNILAHLDSDRHFDAVARKQKLSKLSSSPSYDPPLSLLRSILRHIHPSFRAKLCDWIGSALLLQDWSTLLMRGVERIDLSLSCLFPVNQTSCPIKVGSLDRDKPVSLAVGDIIGEEATSKPGAAVKLVGDLVPVRFSAHPSSVELSAQCIQSKREAAGLAQALKPTLGMAKKVSSNSSSSSSSVSLTIPSPSLTSFVQATTTGPKGKETSSKASHSSQSTPHTRIYSPTIVLKLNANRGGGMWRWSPGIFRERFLLTRDLVNAFHSPLLGQLDLSRLNIVYPPPLDPLSDIPNDELVGVGFLFLDALQYLLDVDDTLPILNFRGTVVGSLKVKVRCWIDKIETLPSYLSVDRESHARDFLNKKMIIRFYFESLVGLPKMKCASPYLRFKFYFHKQYYRLPRHFSYSQNAFLHSTLQIEQKITYDFLEYLSSGSVEVEVFAKKNRDLLISLLTPPSSHSTFGFDMKSQEKEKDSENKEQIEEAEDGERDRGGGSGVFYPSPIPSNLAPPIPAPVRSKFQRQLEKLGWKGNLIASQQDEMLMSKLPRRGEEEKRSEGVGAGWGDFIPYLSPFVGERPEEEVSRGEGSHSILSPLELLKRGLESEGKTSLAHSVGGVRLAPHSSSQALSDDQKSALLASLTDEERIMLEEEGIVLSKTKGNNKIRNKEGDKKNLSPGSNPEEENEDEEGEDEDDEDEDEDDESEDDSHSEALETEITSLKSELRRATEDLVHVRSTLSTMEKQTESTEKEKQALRSELDQFKLQSQSLLSAERQKVEELQNLLKEQMRLVEAFQASRLSPEPPPPSSPSGSSVSSLGSFLPTLSPTRGERKQKEKARSSHKQPEVLPSSPSPASPPTLPVELSLSSPPPPLPDQSNSAACCLS